MTAASAMPAEPTAPAYRGGWARLVGSALCRGYLVFTLTLAACALLPMLFGLTGSVVQSGSMEPLISTGDVVLSQPLPAGPGIPLGRVISFATPGAGESGFVLHRLVAVDDDGALVTAGDANADVDSTRLQRSDIISQGRLLIPWIGLPSYWAGTGAILPLGVWLLLTAGAVAVASADIAVTRRETPRQGRHRWFSTRAARGTLALTVLLTATAVVTAPLGQSAAGFSARTASAGNAWSTAASFPVDLRTAATFALISGTRIDNSSSTRITGDVGISPGTTLNGFPPGRIDGHRERNTAVAITAQKDAAMAYTSLSTRRATAQRNSTLTGTVAPGVYASKTGSFTVSGTLRLDGGGNADSVFIFQSSQRLTAAAHSRVDFVNGATPSNVYWSVGSTATLRSGSSFAGTIVARGTVTAEKKVTVVGRLISTGGAVSLSETTVNLPG